MKSNEVHYYDLSGNDSWQLKMIKLINIFNYSIRQIQSTKCILNGVHQEPKQNRDILNSSSRNCNVIESNWKVIHNYMEKKKCNSLLSITCNWKYAQLHITFNYFQICN
jgi:hypothetical protein